MRQHWRAFAHRVVTGPALMVCRPLNRALIHRHSGHWASTGLFSMRQHLQAFAHRVGTGPPSMVCRPLSQALIHRHSGRWASTGLFWMRQHWRAFAHRVVTGPPSMVCRPLSQALIHRHSGHWALTGLFLMRQHWRAFAHRVVTGPLLMVCRPLGQALIHRDSGRQASMRLFSLCPEQVDPVCFPPEAQPFSLPFCLSHRRFVGRRFQVARQLLAHFLLPVSMPPQVALAAPPTDVLDRQADSVDLVVRVARLPEARDAFSTIRSSDRKASALRLSAFVAPRQQRRLVSRRPQVPDLASKLFHFDFAVSLFQVNLQSDSFG